MNLSHQTVNVPWIVEQLGANLHVVSTKKITGSRRDKDGNDVPTFDKGYTAYIQKNWGPPKFTPNPDGEILAKAFDSDRTVAALTAAAEAAGKAGIPLVQPTPENLLARQVEEQARELAELRAMILGQSAQALRPDPVPTPDPAPTPAKASKK